MLDWVQPHMTGLIDSFVEGDEVIGFDPSPTRTEEKGDMTARLLELLQERTQSRFLAFLPELILCGAIVLMLLLRLFKVFDNGILVGSP